MSTQIHLVNIATHVFLGVCALLLGVLVLTRPKGDAQHRVWGRIFVLMTSGVATTAAIGFAFFRRDAALGAVTLLVAYQLFSGVRAAGGRAPVALDATLAGVAFVAGVGFVAWLLTGAPNFWRPQITAAIGCALVGMAGYDLLRLFAPRWRQRIWPLEHGVKMMCSIGALVSAGLGTIAPAWQPFSQLAPSAAVTIYAVSYIFLRRNAASAVARTEAW